MDRYHLLPVFTGPNMLPEERMAHFRDNIRPNMQYCGLTYLTKLIPWCKYIKDYDIMMKMLKKSTTVIEYTNYSTMNSIIGSVSDAGCYDSYYCNVPSLASTIHSLMVAMCTITLLGLVGNIFCFIKMHTQLGKDGARTSLAIFLSAIMVLDSVKLLLISLLYIVPALSGNQYKDQLATYQRFTFKLVPTLLPLLDLSFAVASWLVVASLVQRSNVTRVKLIIESEGLGFVGAFTAKDRRRAYCSVALTAVALFVFSLPKFAEYTFNYHIMTGEGIVVPLLRVLRLYRIVYLKFLSPNVECMIPIIVMLTYIAVIKYNEVLLARHRHTHQPETLDAEKLVHHHARGLSVTGISRKTQLVIWISVVVLFNLAMKLSDIFVELERNLSGSPKEEWPRLRQITKYLSVSVSVVSVAAKPFIYVHYCPRLLTKNFSRSSKADGSTV